MDGLLIFVIYSAWAIYSGYKFINGRYECLERNETKSKVCKGLAILGAGYVIGAFYFCSLVIKFAIRITDGFK